MPTSARAESKVNDAAQWLSHGKDDSQQRYSPLTQISVRTVNKLGLKWSLSLPIETGLVSTPLMVGDTLYFTGRYSVVYAVSARTGQIQWTFDPKALEELAKVPRRTTYHWGTSRGVAYHKGTIIVASVDGRLICISAENGQPVWSTQTIDPSNTNLYISSVPLIFGDKVLIGNAGGDFGATRGYVTAYAADTGKQLWRFFTVPGDPAKGFENAAMEKAAKTWSPGWWKTTGGGNVWNGMTYDSEFNRIYIGTGNGSPWNQKIRGRAGGDNLYVASIVALDANTGSYVWHYQVVPGDNWDFDAAAEIVLAEVAMGGTNRKVLMQANKDGFFYVIDRVTGKLISAEKYAHATWADRIDPATGRPVEAANVRPAGPSSSVITVWPWVVGAHSWPPMSFSPRTGLMYIPGMDGKQVFDARGIDPNTYKADRVEQWLGYSDIIGRHPDEGSASSTPDTAEQSSWLQARDPRTNKRIWQVKQPGLWSGGTLATAGDLVFIGQASGHLAAYEARTGEELWKFYCGRPITAAPISYEIDGIQYVAVLVGWGGTPAVEGGLDDPKLRMTYRDGGRGLFVFALNGNASPKLSAPAVVKILDVPGFVPDPVKVQRGEHLFDNNCNLCHGTDAVSGGSTPDLRASPLAADKQALTNIVLHGALLLRGMPHYVDFSESEVDDIYHYIRYRARTDLACAAASKGDKLAQTASGCSTAFSN